MVITFSCHFANIVSIDEFCGNIPWKLPSRPTQPVRGSKTKSFGNINTGHQPLGKWRRHRLRVDADYLASRATCGRAVETKRHSRNRQILLISRINIRNWASISRRSGFQFPHIRARHFDEHVRRGNVRKTNQRCHTWWEKFLEFATPIRESIASTHRKQLRAAIPENKRIDMKFHRAMHSLGSTFFHPRILRTIFAKLTAPLPKKKV